MWIMLLPIFGFLIGIVAALTGIGGGAFIVPLLTLLYAISPPYAAGISLTTIVFTSIAATLNYSRQKRIYYKTGLVLALATAPGAVLGALLSSMVPARLLGVLFGFFLIIGVALPMAFDPRRLRRHSSVKARQDAVKSDNELVNSVKTMFLGGLLNFVGGTLSGLLGIGGGVLIVPTMTLVMGMSIHFATATSMFTMIFTSISGGTTHYFAGQINFEFALLLASGSIFGAQVGAYVSKRVSNVNLRRIFGLLLLVIGIQMILTYI
jgi:hypothetical protein